MLLIATLGNDIRFVFTMNQVISDNKMQQLSNLLFYKKEICSLIRNCKALGQNKETNSSQVTTNSQSCWLNERTASHINHQYTYLESYQLDKENISQESEQTRLIFKEGILKFKSKMQERLSLGETFSQFYSNGKSQLNSVDIHFHF
jgi:hypothetical protein